MQASEEKAAEGRVHSMHHGALSAPYGEVQETQLWRKNWRLRSLNETTSHSTRLQKTAAKSLVIP